MKNKEINLFQLLETIPDFRRKQGTRQSLPTVLTIIIMAIMSGARRERSVTRFAKNNKDELIKLLRIEREELTNPDYTKPVPKSYLF